MNNLVKYAGKVDDSIAMGPADYVLMLMPASVDEAKHMAQRHRVDLWNISDAKFYLGAVMGVTTDGAIPVMVGIAAVSVPQRFQGPYTLEVIGMAYDEIPGIVRFLYTVSANASRALGYHKLVSRKQAHAPALTALGWKQRGSEWFIALTVQPESAGKPLPAKPEPDVLDI